MIKLSLCIPNYNRAKSLIRVIEDCKNQTVPPFEIVITDDQSDHDELVRIQEYIKASSGIRFSVNKKNLGLAGNTNAVIQMARGNYIAIINNDDRISKYYVEAVVEAIRRNPEFNVFTTNAMGMTEDGKVVGDLKIFSNDGVLYKKSGARRLWDLYFFTFITISGTTIYKADFIKRHLFDVPLGNEADLDNALRMLATEDIYYLDKPIYYVVLHSDQESTKIRADEKKLDAYITRCLSLYSKYQKQYDPIPLYLWKIKSIYFFQLLLKYRYPLPRIRELLDISSWVEIGFLTLLLPPFLLSLVIKNMLFKMRYSSYVKYFPSSTNSY